MKKKQLEGVQWWNIEAFGTCEQEDQELGFELEEDRN